MRDKHRYKFRRRGSMYVAILGCATVVTVLGVSAILAARVEGKVLRGCADLAAARHLAHSSVDLGLFAMYDDPNWRTTKVQGGWRLNEAAGDGSISLSVLDPIDGVLSDAKWEPIVFTSTGAVRDARYMIEATAIAQPFALPALNTSLHASGNVSVKSGRNITVTGAPLSMNGSINGPGIINGNVHAGSLGLLPIIVGTSTIPSPAKQMPDAGVFDLYKNMATVIAKTDMDKIVLTSTSNPWGTPNANGIYYMDSSAGDITIKSSRIEATLVIYTGTKKVTLDQTLFLKSGRTDFPTLIVKGKLIVSIDAGTLSENGEKTNFNPAASPYLGVGDTDQTDSYPNDLQGLIHVIGPLTIEQDSVINGSVLCEGDVIVDHAVSIVHTPSLYTNPPMGYVSYAMQLASGSWRRIVNP